MVCVISKEMKYFIITLLSIGVLLIAHFSGAFGRENHFFISCLFFFIATLLINKFAKKKIDLFWILGPTLIIFLITAVYAAIVDNNAGLPIPFFLILSVFIAIIIYRLKTNKLLFVGLYVLLLISISYLIYPNWVHFAFDDENPINKDFPKELVLLDDKGNIYDLSKDKGKVIVLDLWSTSCGVCFKKFPDFEKQKNKYKNDPSLKFYTVNLALKRDSTINVKKYVKDYSFKTLYADTNSWKLLENRSVPKLLIINKDFKIVYKGTLYDKWYHFYNNFTTIIKNLKNE